MALAPTLDGRLICACNCAYQIDDSGTLPTDPTDRYYSGAGFAQAPKTFTADGINACLVGTTADGVVLAFRGTLSFNFDDLPSLKDWLNNFTAELVRPEWLPDDSPARVHQGFLGSLESLRTRGAFDEANRQLQAVGPGARLLITGHSKGGAMASLAALRFWAKNQTPSQVVTFAAPRVGDRAFADVYNNAQIVHTRYEFQDDVVPHLPPRLGGLVDQLNQIPWIGSLFADIRLADYESVGELRFIDWSNEIEPDSLQLERQRDLHLVWIIWRQEFDRFVQDHEIQCKAEPGYMGTVCPVVSIVDGEAGPYGEGGAP
jgi:hypothetical protein